MSYLLTPAGFEKLKKEIKEVKAELGKITVLKGEAVQDTGNLWHDNFSFEEMARQELVLARRLAKLQKKLKAVKIVDERKKHGRKAVVGSTVTIEYEDGRQVRYTITDPEMTNPGKGLISYRSKVGEALLGSRKGDERQLQIRDKVSKFKVVKVVV